MRKFSLENHLKCICDNNPEYTPLISTWYINKKTCIDALKNIVISYPHFSSHDVSHSDAVITKIEMILGERVHTLSPTDTWLLLHSAYTHDLGMILRWEDIEAFWKDPKFNRFLNSMMDSTDGQLREAATTIHSIISHSENGIFTNPLKISQYVTLINAAYFRRYHSELSRKYIDLWEHTLKIDLGHNGLIQPRLIKLLGRICELHTLSPNEILNLDYQTDGFGADYAHPRFVAMILRLGDLLDADNSRFNPVSTLTIGELPDNSRPHNEKHESTTHLLVTPTDIEFRSDCSTQEAYLETRNFITWLESEIDFFKKYWDIIAPTNLGGYVPRFNKKELLYNSVPDIDGVTGLKFQITQKKAFQIIEGANIYSTPFTCFREILQNAFDATKIQLWIDLLAGNYIAWMNDKKIDNTLQPYEIDKTIFKNYSIQLNLSTLKNGKTQVEITDRGTGISIENFKRICNVGISTSTCDINEDLILSMPKWLRPTGGFGIGLQSIFLIADKFEITTSTGTEAYHAILYSNRSGGYFQLHRIPKIPARGTTVRVQFKSPNNYSYIDLGPEFKNHLGNFDPFSYADYIGEFRVIEFIERNCTDTFFPIQITSSINQNNYIELWKDFTKNDISEWKNITKQFRYKLSDDCCSMYCWDYNTHSYAKVSILKEEDPYSNSISFKGIKIKKWRNLRFRNFLKIELDVYGLETNGTLSLDRGQLISPGLEVVKELIENISNLYIESILYEFITKNRVNQICSNPNFYTINFWKECSIEQREKLPDEFYDYVDISVSILKRGNNGQFIEDKKPAKDIMRTLTSNIHYFAKNFTGWRTSAEFYHPSKAICTKLNQVTLDGISEVIVDPFFHSVSRDYYWKQIIIPNCDNPPVIYTTTDSKTCGCQVNDNLRDDIIKGLTSKLLGIPYRNYDTDEGMRYAIPALSDYTLLSVNRVPVGILTPSISTHYIIAPFTSDFKSKPFEMSKENFVNTVIEHVSFNKLVAYVKEHGLLCKDKDIVDIQSEYKRLIEEYYDIQIKKA